MQIFISLVMRHVNRMKKETDDHTVTLRKTQSHWIITSRDKKSACKQTFICQINLVNGIISEKICI